MSRLVWLPAAVAQPTPLGPEFQVNTYTTGYQFGPAVAVARAGNLVVVGTSHGIIDSGDTGASVQAQRYDASGAPQGEQFLVSLSDRDHAAVAADAAGNFVVVWSGGSYGGTDTSLSSILAQRYDSNGVAQGGQFQVKPYTHHEQYNTPV